jgi:hypothetical protein
MSEPDYPYQKKKNEPTEAPEKKALLEHRHSFPQPLMCHQGFRRTYLQHKPSVKVIKLNCVFVC